MLAIDEESKRFFKTLTEYQWGEWLQLGFVTSKFLNYLLHDEPSVPIQVARLFNSLPTQNQILFKTALIRLIAEWDISAQSNEVLIDYCFLVAQIRASSAIKHLRTIIESEQLDILSEEQRYRTIQVVIGVIAGFAPLEDAKEALERFFWSATFDYKYTTQLFLGLCECSPGKYSSYFERFIDLVGRHPEDFRLDYVMAEFVAIVSLQTIAQTATELSESSILRLGKLLYGYSWSPAELVFDTDPHSERSHGVYLLSKYEQNEDLVPFTLQLDQPARHVELRNYVDLTSLFLSSKVDQLNRLENPIRMIQETFDHHFARSYVTSLGN